MHHRPHILSALPIGLALLSFSARETHASLFDGINGGFELTDRPAFSVQYLPEASPGPQDSFYLFEKFIREIRKAKA